MRNPRHPTRERLIEVVANLLQDKTAESITVDEVLQTSGISKGSLYHHFVDFPDLIDCALARQFTLSVTSDIEGITQLAVQSQTEQEFWAGLDQVTRESQAATNRPRRYARLEVVARASRNENFRKLLAEEQEQLTTAFADLVCEGQSRGWVNADVDPRSVAVLVQAYTLGRTLDDITDEHVDPDQWTQLIIRVVRQTLTPAK